MPSNARSLLQRADPVLAQVIQLVPQPEVQSSGNVFMDLMSCIIEQQIHYRSTKKTFAKLLALANLNQLSPANFAVLEEKALHTVKLSAGKYETMQRVLTFFQAEQPAWNDLTNEQVAEKLASIKGIGRWTIDMILLYTLQRPDIFPADDYHLKKIMVPLYALNPNENLKRQMEAIAQHWRPHRSLAVRYLLAYQHGKKTKA